MNLFGALEAVTHQHADAIADLIAAAKAEQTRFEETSTIMLANEMVNTDARRAALKAQWELLDQNEVDSHNSRNDILRRFVQETKDSYDKLDAALTQIRVNILSGDFKFKPRVVQPDPITLEPDPADLELLPPSGRAGELETSVNET